MSIALYCILVAGIGAIQLVIVWLLLFGGARTGRRRMGAERRGQGNAR